MPSRRGFTLIEAMIAVAVIAILATLALPSLQARIVRGQIVEAAKLADVAKGPVAAAWLLTKAFPADNTEAGLPVADKIVSDLVKSVTVENGAIDITFGNKANGSLQGKVLTLRPAVVTDAPVVPVTWLCAKSKAPDKMTAFGVDRTNIDEKYLPLNCH